MYYILYYQTEYITFTWHWKHERKSAQRVCTDNTLAICHCACLRYTYTHTYQYIVYNIHIRTKPLKHAKWSMMWPRKTIKTTSSYKTNWSMVWPIKTAKITTVSFKNNWSTMHLYMYLYAAKLGVVARRSINTVIHT